MAIAEMSRMKLIGISCEEEKLLSALHKTCAVQIISKTPMEGVPQEGFTDGFVQKMDRLSFAYTFILTNGNRVIKDGGLKLEPFTEAPRPVTYDGFMGALSLEEELEPFIEKAYELNDRFMDRRGDIAAITAERNLYEPFKNVNMKLSDLKDTRSTRVFFGQMPTKGAAEFAAEQGDSCIAVEEWRDGTSSVLSVVCHKDDEAAVWQGLSSLGFVRFEGGYDGSPAERFSKLTAQLKEANKALSAVELEIAALVEKLPDMALLLDRYSFEIDKNKKKQTFDRTNATYLLEAFVPTEAVDRVKEAVKAQTDTVFVEFEKVPRSEFAPTLMKNGKVTKQFEFITNMFSPPSYGEVDHNFIMMIFFSVFMGFIMADWGYGLLMAVGGALFARTIKRDTGLRRLAYIIAVGGVFTVIFGLLFDSFFGYPLLQRLGILSAPIMPDAINHKLSLAGISVPTLLLLSLGFGVVQIIASLLIKAWGLFRQGKILDGIFEGVVWAVFLIALVLLVLELASITSGLMDVAIWTLVGAVVIGALTAGIHERGFGKFTKGFSAVWGIINYLSDILSYARLYGLMLSGAQIGSIVTTMALPMMKQGPMAIVAVLILLIGHAFNIAMGVLGAYIHDSRLQYIEFYGRFYTGDGELFTPFGTTFEHVYFADKKQQKSKA